MHLRITGETTYQYHERLNNVMNLITMICLEGSIPQQRAIDNPSKHEGWWYREGDKFVIGMGNNNWVHVIREDICTITLWYHGRYKSKEMTLALENLLLTWFDFIEEVEINS